MTCTSGLSSDYVAFFSSSSFCALFSLDSYPPSSYSWSCSGFALSDCGCNEYSSIICITLAIFAFLSRNTTTATIDRPRTTRSAIKNGIILTSPTFQQFTSLQTVYTQTSSSLICPSATRFTLYFLKQSSLHSAQVLNCNWCVPRQYSLSVKQVM